MIRQSKLFKEHTEQGSSSWGITFWVLKGCPIESSIIRRIIDIPRWPRLSCQGKSSFGFVTLGMLTLWDSITLILVTYNPEETEWNFSKTFLLSTVFEVMRRYSFSFSSVVSTWNHYKRVSLNLSRFLVAFLEYRASYVRLIWQNKTSFSETSIMYDVPDTVQTCKLVLLVNCESISNFVK